MLLSFILPFIFLTLSSCFRMKTAVLNLMTDYLGQDELAMLKKTFTAIDENGDGTITLVELKKAFAK